MKKLLLFSTNEQTLREKKLQQQTEETAKQDKGNMHTRVCGTEDVQIHGTSSCYVNHFSLYFSYKKSS